jgi:hypothetical protein
VAARIEGYRLSSWHEADRVYNASSCLFHSLTSSFFVFHFPLHRPAGEKKNVFGPPATADAMIGTFSITWGNRFEMECDGCKVREQCSVGVVSMEMTSVDGRFSLKDQISRAVIRKMSNGESHEWTTPMDTGNG